MFLVMIKKLTVQFSIVISTNTVTKWPLKLIEILPKMSVPSETEIAHFFVASQSVNYVRHQRFV